MELAAHKRVKWCPFFPVAVWALLNLTVKYVPAWWSTSVLLTSIWPRYRPSYPARSFKWIVAELTSLPWLHFAIWYWLRNFRRMLNSYLESLVTRKSDFRKCEIQKCR